MFEAIISSIIGTMVGIAIMFMLFIERYDGDEDE